MHTVMAMPVTSLCPHPNAVDRLRIEKLLAGRSRYKYVAATVTPCTDGYLVRSPCCSRTVDPQGGEIDIARIEYQSGDFWRLYRKDDVRQCWRAHAEFHSLSSLLDVLIADVNREFWR